MKRLIQIIIVVLSAITLFSCGTVKKSQPAPLPSILPADNNTNLTETYWKLTELNGQPVSYADGNKKEMHLILKKEGNRVNGHAGCNSFMGTYTLLEGNRISFSQLAGTLMACPNMELEKQFMDLLQRVDNYAVKGNALSLNKARMAPLARFEAVYMK